MGWNKQDTIASLSFPGAWLPEDALYEAIKHYDEIQPELHDALRLSPDAIQALEVEPEADYMLQFFAMYLAAAVRDRAAFPLICDFFTRYGEAATDITGDLVVEHLDRILASLCEDDADLLKAAAELPGMDDWTRAAFFGALGQLHYAGLLDYERIVSWFHEWLTGDTLNQSERTSLAHECLSLALADMEEPLHRALTDGRIDLDSMNDAEISAAMSRTEAPDYIASRYGMVDDVVEMLRLWFPDEDAERGDEPLLEPDELVLIAELLDAYNVAAEERISLECLHGYIFAVVLIPEQLSAHEWLPHLFAGEMPPFTSIEEANSRFGALMQVYNRLNALRQQGLLHCPVGIRPGDGRIELNDVREWCRGFVLASGLRGQYWSMDDDKTGAADVNLSMAVILSIADDVVIDVILKEGGDEGENRNEFLAGAILALPDAVRVLCEHTKSLDDARIANMQPLRSDKVGRNVPCPCGSGKKFKKCCGDPSRPLH
ncbi:MAG: UPF0149 family protein [Mariprofundus sp.]